MGNPLAEAAKAGGFLCAAADWGAGIPRAAAAEAAEFPSAAEHWNVAQRAAECAESLAGWSIHFVGRSVGE